MFALRADPDCLPALKRAGFTFLSVANNHTMDYGRDAFFDTLRALAAQGIVPVGGGKNYAEATDGMVVRKNGLRMGILGFSAFPGAAGGVSRDSPSMAVMRDERLSTSIRSLKKRCDVVVVSCHWGLEGVAHHSETQERLAHRAIDAGASLVLGHHPHVAQEIEKYRGGVVVYSLGNFVFDEKSHEGKSGLIFRCRLSTKGVTSYSAVPIRIDHCRPKIVN
jgi:poly-gamma-glutamate synthesis protein (capsule biosynthesis protein)